MSEWQSMRIGQHVTIIPGFPFDSNRFDDEDGVPLVRIRDLLAGTTETKFNGHYDPLYLIGPGDILVGMDGDFNIARWKGGTALLNQRMLKIADKKSGEIDCRFLFYVLGPLLKDINNKTSATTVKHLSTYDISDAFIPAPPLPHQRKIARILTTVDNLIEKTEALIAKYQAIKQGMMHDLFTRGVDEHGHLRPPYEQAPELYKQSELGWIPKEWSVRSLGEVAVVGGGVTLGRDLTGNQVVELPYLRVANVQDGYLDLSEIKTVSVMKSEVDRYRLEQGDMLMTEGGDFDKLGRGTVWRGQISPCLHQNHIFRVRPSKEFILPDFLAANTASSYGKRYFLVSSKQTTNLATINSTQLKAFPVPLPNLDEQGRMIAAIASVERQIEAEQRQSKQLQQTKTGLMQDLLTGKVRVKADESEEVAAHV